MSEKSKNEIDKKTKAIAKTIAKKIVKLEIKKIGLDEEHFRWFHRFAIIIGVLIIIWTLFQIGSKPSRYIEIKNRSSNIISKSKGFMPKRGYRNKYAGLENIQVERVINENIPQVRTCYENALKNHPKLSGKVVAHFSIGEAGSVIDSAIFKDSLQVKSVGICIKESIKLWKFPKPKNGMIVRIKYPFLFQSGATK